MKDKLVKHHRKSSYFTIRRLIIISLGVLFLVTSIAVPLTVSYVASQNNTIETTK